jgi:hypothetical protein
MSNIVAPGRSFETAVSIYKESQKQKRSTVDQLLITIGNVFMDNLTPPKETFTRLDVKKQGKIELQSEKIAGVFAVSLIAGTYLTISSMPKKI